MPRLPAVALAALATIGAVNAAWIVRGGRWRDSDGELVNAHAGGVTVDQESGEYYWFGEYKIEGTGEGGGMSSYSSDDLVNWTFEGSRSPSKDHPYISLDDIIQRPKVAYSDIAGQYYVWWHADNSTYGLLLQGLAVSDTIQGPYEFVNATPPLGNYSHGNEVYGRDTYITSFNEAITKLDEAVHRFNKFDLEAPIIVQTENSYFCLMSHKTGYRPNNVVALRADSLSGPWSKPFIVAPLNTRTYNSQSSFSMRIHGTKATTSLYMSDQWDSNSLWESRYIWLPMAINESAKTLEVLWYDVYDLNVETGEYTPIEGTKYYAYEGEVAGNARLQEANFAHGNMIATDINVNDSTLTFTGMEGHGGDQWVSFYYQNIDDMGFGDQPEGAPDRVGGE